jgi:hypothetical protein
MVSRRWRHFSGQLVPLFCGVSFEVGATILGYMCICFSTCTMCSSELLPVRLGRIRDTRKITTAEAVLVVVVVELQFPRIR